MVLPTLVVDNHLHSYAEFFDEEHLCGKLPAGCISFKQLEEETERIRKAKRTRHAIHNHHASTVLLLLIGRVLFV